MSLVYVVLFLETCLQIFLLAHCSMFSSGIQQKLRNAVETLSKIHR